MISILLFPPASISKEFCEKAAVLCCDAAWATTSRGSLGNNIHVVMRGGQQHLPFKRDDALLFRCIFPILFYIILKK
jgi:hypothetical protein